jgi:hypothetical protein
MTVDPAFKRRLDMTLQRGSAVRRTSRKKVAPELEAAEAGERTDSGHTSEIERRAYEIYEGRNGAAGDPVADWLQAERELRDAKTTGRK